MNRDIFRMKLEKLDEIEKYAREILAKGATCYYFYGRRRCAFGNKAI